MIKNLLEKWGNYRDAKVAIKVAAILSVCSSGSVEGSKLVDACKCLDITSTELCRALKWLEKKGCIGMRKINTDD